jgi:hypothetical protein
LRGPRLRADDDAVLHDAGPEPFTNQAQDDPSATRCATIRFSH